MPITNIKVSNFKSFKNIDIDLNNFCLLIGANVAGKTNFISFLEFLNDIVRANIELAIYKQGGIKFLRNLSLKEEALSFSITIKKDLSFPIAKTDESQKIKKILGIDLFELDYELTIDFINNSQDWKINEEEIIFRGNMYETDFSSNNTKQIGSNDLKHHKKGKTEPFLFKLRNDGNDVDYNLENNTFGIKKENIIHPPTINSIYKIPNVNKSKQSILTVLNKLPMYLMFENMNFFDLDPKKCKRVNVMDDRFPQLGVDGGNLPIIVQNLIKDEENKRKLLNLINYLLPTVKEIKIENVVNNVTFKIKEEYSDEFILSYFLSDGTANIVALYFNQNEFISIEEPDRNIPPKLISNIVGMMDEVARKKQVIITTHNPEVLKYVDDNNIYLISRDKEGFSNISKPVDNEELKSFLDEELGIEDLFIDDLLDLGKV
ncbi:MAG: AAA family ATPase [Methanobrevibacter sp.]|nr:AAA family ATPase [Candidatus Methanovirga aequatorialis]